MQQVLYGSMCGALFVLVNLHVRVKASILPHTAVSPSFTLRCRGVVSDNPFKLVQKPSNLSPFERSAIAVQAHVTVQPRRHLCLTLHSTARIRVIVLGQTVSWGIAASLILLHGRSCLEF